MMKKENKDTKVSSFQTLKFLREEIRFQHTVISFRMTWYVATQAILMTTFAISRSGVSSSDLQWFWGVLVPGIAILFSIIIWPTIDAAWSRILVHREKIDQLKQEKLFTPHDMNRSSQAMLYARILPMIFGVFWIIVVIMSR